MLETFVLGFVFGGWAIAMLACLSYRKAVSIQRKIILKQEEIIAVYEGRHPSSAGRGSEEA